VQRRRVVTAFHTHAACLIVDGSNVLVQLWPVSPCNGYGLCSLAGRSWIVICNLGLPESWKGLCCFNKLTVWCSRGVCSLCFFEVSCVFKAVYSAVWVCSVMHCSIAKNIARSAIVSECDRLFSDILSWNVLNPVNITFFFDVTACATDVSKTCVKCRHPYFQTIRVTSVLILAMMCTTSLISIHFT
jgi:hypothetical protein